MNTETLHLPSDEVAADTAVVTTLPLMQRHVRAFQDAHDYFIAVYGTAPSINEMVQFYLVHVREDDVVQGLEYTIMASIQASETEDRSLGL